ncbi:uncharacterized protein [Haliotis asinina]|uniref:uncharacterized protein isoform X2 n=1 Tax=Haliotis asinina TaxID=109174 RepID=UPI003531ABFD
MENKKKTTRAPESSTNIKPKGYYDEEEAFTVDFTNNEDKSWTYFTEWTCIPKSGPCEIILTRRINEHLCNMMRHFDKPPSMKLVSLRNPDQKVTLVFGHDTEADAFNMFNKFTHLRNTVLSFLKKVTTTVEDIKMKVQLTGTIQSARQQDQEYRCIFDSTAEYSEEDKSETTWLCKPDTLNLEVDNETRNSHFTRFKENITRSFEACLGSVSAGSVIFTFHHRSTEDALGMISKHAEVRAMILECLQGIASTVKDIQIEVQLQDFIDPHSLPAHGVQDRRYVDKQEHDKVVQDLSEEVANLKQQLQDMKEMERAQLADIRLSMWETRPGSPQSSETSGIFTAADTMTDVGGEDFQDTTDLSEPGGSHRKHGDASKPQHMSETVTDLRRQLAETRQELKATKERMHRLEITHKKGPVTRKKADSQAWSEMEALKPGRTPKYLPRAGTHGSLGLHQDTRATPTPSRRDARADADLRDACWWGKLEELKRILDTGRADVNSRDGVGRTPVMWAALRGHRNVVELLVSRGADVSLVDDGGYNILHWACMRGDRKTVEFVLSLDAVDVNARNSDGQTAADVARDLGHRQLSDLLVSRGTQ